MALTRNTPSVPFVGQSGDKPKWYRNELTAFTFQVYEPTSTLGAALSMQLEEEANLPTGTLSNATAKTDIYCCIFIIAVHVLG